MNRRLAALSVAMAAPIASGQSWEFELDNPILTPSDPSTTVRLSLDHPPSDWAVAGVNFNVHASRGGGEWSDPASLVPPSAAPPVSQIPGTISGLSVLKISVGQLAPRLGFSPQPGRIDLWQATFTATDLSREYMVDLNTETTRFAVYLEPGSIPIPYTREITAIEGQYRLAIIPAPGALALLGLGGLAAVRRRR